MAMSRGNTLVCFFLFGVPIFAQEVSASPQIQAFVAEQSKQREAFQQVSEKLRELQRALEADPNLPYRNEIVALRQLAAETRALRVKVERATAPIPATGFEISSKYIELKIGEKTRELAARDKALHAERAAISARMATLRTELDFAAQLEAAAAEQVRAIRQDRLVQKETAELQELQQAIAPAAAIQTPRPMGFDLTPKPVK
jgi:hypothetical protein